MIKSWALPNGSVSRKKNPLFVDKDASLAKYSPKKRQIAQTALWIKSEYYLRVLDYSFFFLCVCVNIGIKWKEQTDL